LPVAAVRSANLNQVLQANGWSAGVRVGWNANGNIDILADFLRAGLAAECHPGSSRTLRFRHEQSLPLEPPTEPAQLRPGKILRRRLIPRPDCFQTSARGNLSRAVDTERRLAGQLLFGPQLIVHGE